MKTIKSISDVVENQLCTGCGICTLMEPERFHMGNALEFGRRPFLSADPAPETGDALASCPGVALSHAEALTSPPFKAEMSEGWGPVIDVWEGYACSEDVRWKGSSGGAATALASFALSKDEIGGVIHTDARKDTPYLNETVYSRTDKELLKATGSRYAPASPCDGLENAIDEPLKSVFIGKPCDVAAVSKAKKLNPKLAEKIDITIAFFCAGAPSTKGTLELLKEVGISDPTRVKSLRYRGNGWPGMWRVEYLDEQEKTQVAEMTYAESWGFLQKFRQWRCYICPDHTGEFADIAVGDPWYKEIEDGEPGKSLIVARSEKGRDLILEAEKAGYIVLETRDATLLPRSQPNLLGARGSMWGRLMALRVFGVAIPEYSGFEQFKYWLGDLNIVGKRQSIFGTVKRIFRKKLRQRAIMEEWVPSENSDRKC